LCSCLWPSKIIPVVLLFCRHLTTVAARNQSSRKLMRRNMIRISRAL
jgi:hypothetical protein